MALETQPSTAKRPTARRGFFRQYVDVLLISAILALFVRTFLIQSFEIPSASMEPGLKVGDRLLVNKMIFGPVRYDWERKLFPLRPIARGDVAVFRFPEDPHRNLIKRCVAGPGDIVTLKDRELLVNGATIPEPYTQHTGEYLYPSSRFLPDSLRQRDNFGPVKVSQGQLFCLGDNREESNDSRFWGGVPIPNLRGRALAVFWSSDQEASEQADAATETQESLESGWRNQIRLVQ